MTNIETCTIRLQTPTGHPQGTGFILTPTLAVTCVHVVDACGAGPGDLVRLTFQAGNAQAEAEVLADGWHEQADVAFLRLLSPLPSTITPAILGPSANTDSHTFRTLGYPNVGDFQGVWAEGKILGSTTDSQGRHALQLESQNIAPGMSGAPVLDVDTDRVVGMVSLTYNADATLKFRDTAFAIPSETLRDLCPVALELREPEETPRSLGDGETVDMRGAQGPVYKPSGPVYQHFGDVTMQGENLRAQELAYLDGLLKRYEYWLDHYTPLAGIAEVRAAVKDTQVTVTIQDERI